MNRRLRQLQAIEHRANRLHADSRIIVSFADGSQRKVKTSECIPLLKADAAPQVVSIDGDGVEVDGYLLALLRGLTE